MLSGVSNIISRLSFLPVAVLILVLLGGCAQTGNVRYGGLQEEIPDGANRVLLEQEEMPPADAYVDAYHFFERKGGFDIVASEETLDLDELGEILTDDDPLAFTAHGQVARNMAVRVAINVDRLPAGTGALTIASVEYADQLPAEEWHRAEWTKGRARRAFFEGLEIIRGTAYDAVDFEVGVAVAPGEMSRGDLTTMN